jgi:hypothetical protein
MGNVHKQRRKKLFDPGGRTFVEVERICPTRIAVLSKVRSENFTGNVNEIPREPHAIYIIT